MVTVTLMTWPVVTGIGPLGILVDVSAPAKRLACAVPRLRLPRQALGATSLVLSPTDGEELVHRDV